MANRVQPVPLLAIAAGKEAELPKLPLPEAYNGPPDYVILDSNGVVPIRVRCHVMNIHRVDTISQQFDIKLWIQLKWLTKLRPVSAHNPETEWCPDLDFQDYIGELKVDSSLRHSNSGQYTTLTYRYVVEGTFAERLELADFPLDHQQLHVRATIWNAPVKWTYATDDKGKNTVTRDYEKAIKFYRGTSCVYQESFIQRDSWFLRDKVYMEQSVTYWKRNDLGEQFPMLCLFVVAERKVQFFLYNIMLPVFLLVMLAFISFFIDEHELADRMSITLTIVLTLVAFKFIVSQYLPATSYLTSLDLYVVISFIFLALVSLQNLLADTLSPTFPSFNLWSAIVLAAAWVALNILVLILLAHTHKVNRFKVAWQREETEDCFAEDLSHVRDHPDEAIRTEMLDGRTGVGTGRNKPPATLLIPEAKLAKSRSLRAKEGVLEQGEVLSI